MVRSPALLGHLLACPKCGGMVLVVAPAPSDSSPEALSSDAASTTATLAPPAPPITPVAEAPPVLEQPVLEKPENEPEPLIRKRPKHASVKSTRLILVSILVSVALLLGIVYVAVLQRPKPEQTAGERAVVTKNEPVAPIDQEPTVEPEPQPIGTDENENQAEEETQPTDSIAETEPTQPEIDEPEAEGAEIVEQEPPAPPIPVDQAPAIAPEPIRDRIVIDVPARLKLPLASLKGERTTLYKAVSMLADYAGVPVTWDVPGMRLFGVSLDHPLRLDFGESTVGDVLAAVLSQNRLTLLIEHEQIFIYPVEAADPTLREARYDISDLVRPSSESPATASAKNGTLFSVDGAPSISLLTESIPRLVAPFSWESRGGGGHGTLSAEGTVLVVRQAEINHKEIARFLEMLRFVKKNPSGAPKNPSETEPLRRQLFPEQICGELLDKPFTLHYDNPTPAAAVFKLLEQTTGLRILVNHRVLNEAEIPFSELKMKVHVEKGTLHEALRQLLHSVDQLELTYRIVDCETVEVLSWDASLLPEYGTLESHYYGAKLRSEPERTVDDMIAMLKETVEPESWLESTSGDGVIFTERDSETFFVRQSQPIQRVIRTWLKE